MSDEQPDAVSQVISRITGWVTGFGALIAAFLAINSAIVACSDERAARYTAFRTAVGAEEEYWKGLLGDYQATFDLAMMDNEQGRERKLFAINVLADHEVPSFTEHAVDQAARTQATQRLLAMRKSLKDALQNKTASGDAVAEASRNRSYLESQTAVERTRADAEGSPPSSAEISAPPPAITFSYQTRVLSVGDPRGWDVDVLWCQGDFEEQRFSRAVSAGLSLAAKADSLKNIAPSVRLGQIRLVSLPTAAQPAQGGAQRGDFVVFGPETGEQAAAQAIANVAGPTVFAPMRQAGRSQWYVSVFSCA